MIGFKIKINDVACVVGAPADKQSQFYCVNTLHQPLVGKDAAGVTKTGRAIASPATSFLLRRKAWLEVEPSLAKEGRGDSKN